MADSSKQPSDANLTTTTSSDYNTTGSEEEQITLFAPFEANKASGRALSRFQRSSEVESDQRVSSKEIEFQDSESQSAGNAKVLFRKLKAVVSSGGVSSSSYSPTSTPSPAQLAIAKNKSNRQPTLKVHVNVFPPEGSEGKGSHYDKHSSSVSSSVVVTSSGGRVVSLEGTERGQAAREDPRISLTSYSDAHHRRAGREELGGTDMRDGRLEGGAAGGRKGGGGAVNKTEMLKRFGNIANSKVQVCVYFLFFPRAEMSLLS